MYLTINFNSNEITDDLMRQEQKIITFPNGTQITTTEYVPPPESMIKAVNDILQIRKDVNSQLLTAIIAAVSAWIGAIIAFYFGKDSLDKLAKSNKETIAQFTDKTPTKIKTLKEMLDNKPDSRNPIVYDISDKLVNEEQITESLKKYDNTFLYSLKDGKISDPWGVLYKADWNDALKEKVSEEEMKKIAAELSMPIVDLKKEPLNARYFIKDSITNNAWKKDGVKNFNIGHGSDLIENTLREIEKEFKKEILGKIKVILMNDDNTRVEGMFNYADILNVAKTNR